MERILANSCDSDSDYAGGTGIEISMPKSPTNDELRSKSKMVKLMVEEHNCQFTVLWFCSG
jgi:hypothetical protein